MRAWFLLLVSLVIVIAACSSDDRALSSGSTAVALDAPRVKPPADLVPRPRVGPVFEAANGALVSTGATYEAKVRTDGAFEIVPRTIPTTPGPLASARGDALRLSTTDIRRGERALDIRGTSFIADDGAVAIRRGSILERIENDGTGIEQSWRFDRAPAGAGDVVVRVAAGGERYRSATDHGLHFDGAGLGLRYGVATWIDARGVRTIVVPRFVDGTIELTVPHDVIERSAFPAVLDPTISAEREVDVPAAVTAAPGEQSVPAIAALGPGQGYFTVWHDRRSVRPAFVGSRIATNGSISDTTGITIVSGIAAGVTSPSLFASPSGLLLVWTVSYFDQWQAPGIYALRLDNTGKALDAAPIALARNTPNLPLASAAFDGTNWLVTWHRYNSSVANYELYGVRLASGTGPLVDPTPRLVIPKMTSPSETQLVFDGTDYFITWISSGGIYGQRIDKEATAVGAEVLIHSVPYAYQLSSVWSGTQHMSAWYEYVSTAAIAARRYDKLGAPTDGGTKLTLPTAAASVNRPRVAWDGTNFLVTWISDGTSVRGARVSPAGTLVDATGQSLLTMTGYSYEFGVACDGPGGVIVYREYDSTGGSGSDVWGVKVTAGAGLTGAPAVVVSAAANSETDAATAWNGTTYFSVWLDSREKTQTLWGAPISADGTPGTATRLFANPLGGVTYSTFTPPRIASNGSSFLVTFGASQSGCPSSCKFRSIFTVAIDAQGAIQGKVNDLVPVASPASNVTAPDVAWDGTDYFVVYEEQTDGLAIAGRRVKADGSPQNDQVIRVSPLTPGFTEDRRTPSIAFDGTQYFVAWQTLRQTTNSINSIDVGHIFGSRLSKEGTPLDGEIAVCNAFLLQGSPRVAAHPRNGFFVVWEDYRTSLETADIYGGRVSPEGQLLDGDKGKIISNGEHDESRPTVTASEDGSGWIVAWRDLRSKQTYDVYGAWMSAGGVNRDEKGYLFSAEAGDEETPALASGPPGKLLLTYARLDPRTGYGSYRLRARAIDAGKPVGQTCTTGDECASRACVDGFCCSSDCEGCGTCSATPGTCTARPAGTDSPRCNYKCKGALECPTECSDNADCATGATCDKASKQCVTRQICIDARTLQDLTGKQTDCAPYTCAGEACRTTCVSVDDCAPGFVCDQAQRCVPPPNGADVAGCSAAPAGGTRSGAGFAAAIGVMFAIASARRRGKRNLT